jgi:YVTN family beta-propeller protein
MEAPMIWRPAKLVKALVLLFAAASFPASLAAQARGDAPAGFAVTHVIPVGRAPHGIRFSADGSRAYVALSGDGRIAVIDLRIMQVIDRIDVGGTPLDLFPVGTGDDWLVTQFRSDYIARLHEPTARLVVGGGPSLFAPRAAGGRVAVVSELADTLTVIDTQSGRITARLPTGRRPYPPDVTRDGALAFVPNRDANSVSVIDLLNSRIAATTPVCARPQGGALTANDESYIVACGGSNELAYVSTASHLVVARISDGVGPRPFSVAVSEDGRWGLVNNAGGRSVSILDVNARRIVGALPVDSQPIVIRMHPDGRRAFVANEFGETVSVITLPPKPASDSERRWRPSFGAGSSSRQR